MKKFLVVLAVVFGYLAYTASDMGEMAIAIGFGVAMVASVAALVSGGGKKSADQAEPAKAGRRR